MVLAHRPTLLLLKHNHLNAEDNRHTRGQRPIYHLANLKARALWLLRRSRQNSSCISSSSYLGSFFQMQITPCKPVVNLDLKADKYRRMGFFVGQKKRKNWGTSLLYGGRQQMDCSRNTLTLCHRHYQPTFGNPKGIIGIWIFAPSRFAR